MSVILLVGTEKHATGFNFISALVVMVLIAGGAGQLSEKK
jgi:hypothetical protein